MFFSPTIFFIFERFLQSPPEVLARTFLVEFNDIDNWGENLSSDVSKVHALGLRTFAKSNSDPVTATVQNHLDLYAAGIDVTYTYNLTNAVTARIQVNTQRGISPP